MRIISKSILLLMLGFSTNLWDTVLLAENASSKIESSGEKPFAKEKNEEKLQSAVATIKPTVVEIWNAETPEKRMELISERLSKLSEMGLYRSDWDKTQWLERVKNVNENSYIERPNGEKLPLSKMVWGEIAGCVLAKVKTFQKFGDQLESLDSEAGIVLSSHTLVKSQILEDDIIDTVSVIDGTFTRVADHMLVYADRFDPSYFDALKKYLEDQKLNVQDLKEYTGE